MDDMGLEAFASCIESLAALQYLDLRSCLYDDKR
jgi:hypothetical protein